MRRRTASVVASLAVALASFGFAPARLTAPEVTPECVAILHTVERAGLYLPGEFGFRCPDASHPKFLGVTVFNGSTGWVELNLDLNHRLGTSPEYTLAHETCHAWQIDTTGTTTEEAADACATAHGFVYVGSPLGASL